MNREELIVELKSLEKNFNKNDKYRILFDTSPEAIFFQTIGGKILDCNRAACKLYGYTKAQLTELSIIDLMIENYAAKLPENIMRESKSKGIILKEIHRTSDGREFPAEVLTKLITIENEVFRWVVIHDLSDLVNNDKDYIISDNQIRDMIEQLPDVFGEPEIVFIIDTAGTIISANKSFFDKLGYLKNDLIEGLKVYDLFSPDNRKEKTERLNRIYTTETMDIDEITLLKRNGTPLSFLVYSSLIDTEHPQKGMRILAIDITDHKRIEQELVNQEKIHTLGEMTGGVIHDINNILTVIHGYIEIVSRNETVRPEDTVNGEMIEKVKQAAADGRMILKRVQNYYRDGMLQDDEKTFEPVNINDIIDNVIDMHRPKLDLDAANNRRIITIEKYFGAIPFIYANPAELREVVNNLMKNSCEAMPEGGVISFKTFVDDNSVNLDISDTGCGMSDTTKADIFSPFFTTKGENGTGLGMVVSLDIIKKHGGSIEVESEEGSGTTFHIKLPVERRDRNLTVKKETTMSDIPKKVLVIDDEISICELLYQYLTHMGFQVTQTHLWKKAKKYLETNSYDILLVDQNMPEISGSEVAKWIKNKSLDMTVVMITGDDEITLKKLNAQEKLFDKVIIKPIELEKVSVYLKSL